MTTRQFGQPVLRKEDPRLVTGNGRYLDDLGHTAYEAAFVRSPHAHARIADIDVEGALDVEGVVAIFTHEDLEGPAGELFERLRAWRAATAAQASIPAYVVFNDATLQAIAETRPGSLTELSALPGIGARKLELYGVDVLAAVDGELAD